jgi:CDP-glucose 4,6-dehydratase
LLDVFQNKKILITGHTGFKGSWLSLWLKALGAQVTGYSLEPPSQPSNFEACGLEKEIIHIHGDIRDFKHLSAVFNKFMPEIVFHLAAQPLVRLSYKEPRLTYETNVMGTVNVLEACRNTESVRVIVNVTSDKCYENKEWVWGYRETDPVGGRDPYSSSKGCAELVTSAYLKSFFAPEELTKKHRIALASVRAGNVIGGGDWGKDRLVPDCMRALSLGEEIQIRYPLAVRPWQHVLDLLGGYLLLASKLWLDGQKYAGSWNFGPTDGAYFNVEEVTKTICGLWGNGCYYVGNQPNPHEAHWLKLDCSKAITAMGWRPRYSVKEALEKTVGWYKEFYQGRSTAEMMAFNLRQIKDYSKDSDK